MSFPCLNPLVAFHLLSVVKLQASSCGCGSRCLWFQPASSLTTLLLMFSSLLPLPETSQPFDHLVMNLLISPPPVYWISLVLWDPPWKFPHPCGQTLSLSSLIRHSSLLSATGNWTWTWAYCLKVPSIEGRMWERGSYGRQTKIPLLTAWSQVPFGLFAEWRIIEVNWKDLEVSGFLWWLFTSLLPMLK